MKLTTFIALAICATNLPAYAAQTGQHCATIHENAARLSCYDQIFRQSQADITTVERQPEKLTAKISNPQSDHPPSVAPFELLPYKASYVLPLTYNSRPNDNPVRVGNTDTKNLKLIHWETKFQVSFKFDVLEHLLLDNDKIWLGYTQASYWQNYNKESSAPFHETNFEPEVYWSLDTSDWQSSWLPDSFDRVSLGINHQSNGRANTLSRSWNRIIAEAGFTGQDWQLSFKPWWRIPESETLDDNPAIQHYVGYFDLDVAYQLSQWHLRAKLRNNLRSDHNRHLIDIGVTYPLPQNIVGYVQWVNGYGETLLDYNHKVNRIGIGISVDNWF